MKDNSTGESIIGASVSIKGTSIGTSTDIDGKFELSVSGQQAPVTILVASVGYSSSEIVVTDFSKPVTFKLSSKKVELKDVTITGSRVSEKQKEAPLTVESIDMIAIKQSAQNSFYEALGTLKGVDLTSASLGFTIVNTRGFNSTSPVRSLQLIDGVDNQSPGLNFSLGNFLGSSELDVLKVDLIAGASSAYYGPNAFNGVIAMTTRSPFVKPGLELSVKVGERNLVETAVRWSQVVKNKDGFDRFGYKLNFFYMQANDWEANNLNPSTSSEDGVNNAGGYDAVNRYGDEDITGANDATALGQQVQFPGLNRWYRDGYMEKDLVDYNSRNLKIGTAFHYRLKDSSEVILASNFGTGTTVYQGDNRYSLKDILFFQNRLEYRKTDKFFIRAYATNEDAGKSYDAVFTALLMQNAAKDDAQWSRDYRNYWTYNFIFDKAHALPGFPPYQIPYDFDKANEVLAYYSDTVNAWHQGAREYANNGYILSENQPFYQPGTARFDSLLNSVTSRKSYGEGGSGFYDKSALYHAQGEYKFTPAFADVITGGNYRLYAPNSDGTIFSDTTDEPIRNSEFGFYVGLEKYFLSKKLKINLTGRVDKNTNFDALVSPAVSAVYVLKQNHVFRLSFSSAIRNPTLADQYLYYNVGRAILLGNIEGVNSLVTIPSLMDYFNSPTLDTNRLSYFDMDPVRPERVRTAEIGYRATLFKNLFMDVNYYLSMYKDFIGYKIGARIGFDPNFTNRVNSVQVYRVATNAIDEVLTQGFSVGLNYYFWKYYALTGNYTYNFLDRRGSTDPLIPAFNTPTNKFNLGFNGRDIEMHIFNKTIKGIGFNINYKWIDGFQYEGSPQFTGYVESYDIVDAQVNYFIQKSKLTLKLGASNLLNNKVYQVYGGPQVGRLAYFSVLIALTK
ncbi:MAG: TonB-dependent receptor [Bacteroidia bacterium]|nr:TonB-dependent receptor [Bacteroidia bacterium]